MAKLINQLKEWSKMKNSKMIIALVIVILAFGFGYLLREFRDLLFMPRTDTEIITPTSAPLLEGWTYTDGIGSSVKVPTPPKVAPYIDEKLGKYWQVTNTVFEGDQILSVILGDSQKSNYTSIAYKEDNLATDAPIPAIIVNSVDYKLSTTFPEFAEKIKGLLVRFDQNDTEYEKNYVYEINATTRWGKHVVDFSISSQQLMLGLKADTKYSVLVSKDRLYLVTRPKEVDDTLAVQQALDRIYASLKFE